MLLFHTVVNSAGRSHIDFNWLQDCRHFNMEHNWLAGQTLDMPWLHQPPACDSRKRQMIGMAFWCYFEASVGGAAVKVREPLLWIDLTEATIDIGSEVVGAARN